ncbi:hypothetical protein CYMTET_41277 [Cymbomonas tetramitiformis]|uniref:Core-binding (CB) domain-containing protein n=1 Tax=Cymbomonas tetramitiformis TaxID=36881 RepID=A0AAE0C6H4_9CHLO|nr:hypothetical protein CYMTET_41277 [Cymbomonas tetramitiformis]
MMAWGGVLNLKFLVRGFWSDEMRNWHITHLELEAVYKTVQAFLKELEGKVVRLYCDNQAVVAMLSHFTSRNPDLMRRMRRLWLLLDLHDIELQARYIRSEANVWADNLSRCEDLDDWQTQSRLVRVGQQAVGPLHSRPVRFRDLRAASSVLRCVERPEVRRSGLSDVRLAGGEQLGEPPVGAAGRGGAQAAGGGGRCYGGGSVLARTVLVQGVGSPGHRGGDHATAQGPIHSEQAGRVRADRALKVGRRDVLHRGAPVSYYAAEVRRSSASCATAGEVTVGSKIEVFWKDDDCFYPGVVKEFNEDGKAHVLYDGDEETLDLSKENFKIINSSGVSELTDETADADGENIDCGGDDEENKRGGVVERFLTHSLFERWRSELGQSRITELAVKMQKKALLDATMSNYGPKARRFILFCEQHQRPWLPATEATVLLYIASVLKDGGIKSASLQPYLSAINNYHEDLRFPGPAKGRVVTRAVKGMATIQAELAVQEENIETQRTWLPAGHVRRAQAATLKLTPRSSEELRLLRAFSYVVIAFVTFGRPDTGTSLSRQHVHCGDSEFFVVLLKEKGRRHHLVKRRLCIP